MVHSHRFFNLFLCMLIALFAGSSSVMANAPGKPKELKVVAEGSGIAPAIVNLSWVAPSDDTTLEYVVYMASMTANGTTDFKAIIETWKTTASVKDVPAGTHKFYVVARSRGAISEPSDKISIVIKGETPTAFAVIIDPLIQTITVGNSYKFQVKLQYPESYKGGFAYKLERSPAGMTISDKGLIEWANPIVGTHEIAVSAWMLDAPKSQAMKVYKLIVNSDKKTFSITSKPKEQACINKLYVYEAVATVPADGGIVVWSLFTSIDGMSIDEKTGRFSWTPTKEGVYDVKIKAVFIKGNDTLVTYQSFKIVVKSNCDGSPALPPCAKFMGILKDDAGNPIVSGKVKAIRLEKDNQGPSYYETYVRNGQWMLMVREGTYKIRFEGDGFIAEWFENAKEMSQAIELKAICDKIIEIVAKVTPKEKPAMKVIEGMVKDSEGNPVPNSMVSFLIVEANGGSKDGGMKFITKTNDLGNYRIEVPAGMTFIGMAMPNEALAKTHSHVYYDGKRNANEATRFTVTDVMVINFTLFRKASYNNGLAVSIKDTNNVGIKGRVTLHPVPAGKEPKKGYAISVETDSLGNALLSNIEPGTYILQGIPFTRNYAPGFYTSTGFAAMSWKEATKIEVGEVMITIVYDIRLRPVLGKRGAARVDGFIKGRGQMKSDAPLAEQNLGGALIVALDENNEIADYSMSDNAGSYAMYDLGQGTFSIMADMVDYEPSFGTVSTDYVMAADVQKDLTLGSSALSINDPISIQGENVYPNPASQNVTISGLNGHEGNGLVRVYSMMGMMLGEFPIVVENNRTHFSVASLPVGHYMFSIVSNTDKAMFGGQFSIIR